MNVVDLREGEGKGAFVAFVTLFLLVLGHTALETARDTLFLQRLAPSRLTLVYALIALLTLALTPLVARFTRTLGRRNALITSLLVAAYVTVMFHFQRLDGRTVFALYAWSALCGTVLVSQSWLFLSELFTVSQAKRLFGPIAAGGVLGAVAGASLAVGLLEIFEVSVLLLVAAGAFLTAAVVLTSTRSEPASAPSVARREPPASGRTKALIDAFRVQPYLQKLALLVVLSGAALLATDYLFKSSAARALSASELGPFFARYYAVLNAVAFAMQIFGSAALFRRVGVVASLSVLPLLLMVGGVSTAVFGVPLGLVLLLKGADGSLRHSLHRVGSELVQMPLLPSIQERTKAFLDATLPRLTQAAAAAALLVLASFDRQGRGVALFVAGLAAAWLSAALLLRKPYLQLFREALKKGGFETNIAAYELDVNSIEVVVEALSSPDPTRVVGAIELLAEKRRVRLIPGLVLYHEDEAVLVRALEIFSESDRVDWFAHAERLLTHRSESVRAAALRALARRGQYAALERALDDASPKVRALAAFWLVSLDEVVDPASDPRILALFALDGGELASTYVALLGAIADAPHPRWAEVVLAIATKTPPEAFEPVARAMATLADPRFVELLVPRLALRDGRAAVRDALIDIGEPALDALEHALTDKSTPERLRVHLPRTISRFHSQRAADMLLEQLQSDLPGLVRYKVLRGLGRLVAETPIEIDRPKVVETLRKNLLEYLWVTTLHTAFQSGPSSERGERSRRLVLGLLEDKMQQAFERVFRLLQILHRNEDVRAIYYALRSDDRRKRANALELIEALTASAHTQSEKQVRELLSIAVDDLSPAQRVERARAHFTKAPRTAGDALMLLIAEHDESLASFAAFHALELGSKEFYEEVTSELERRPTLNRAAGPVPLFTNPVGLRHAF